MENISKEVLEAAWSEGAEHFINFITDKYMEAVGGQLTAENMNRLNADQHTLLAYRYMKDEVMEGGFIQLIHNGYGPYIFDSPFPIVIKKIWGMKDFSKLIFNVKKEYNQHKDQIEADMSEEDFMALYEQLEKLNDYGDDFLDDFQEETTPAIALYVKENLDIFCAGI
ncbi:MAG: DMP19 family protein [Bacteroides sp.]|nr:DMP19 family protein [Roseburia sp.]MCM1347356.1 DMP19 family protein [Bacteroides sp.]MCM1421393.1 DMP19 family protein [Bacteroides sp.]